MLVHDYVIDASIAGGAGKPTTQRSLNCMALLDRILKGGHFFVLNQVLRSEWKDHASKFARSWLRQMHGRKRLRVVKVLAHSALRKALAKAAINEAEMAGIEKDLHLLELALAHDKLLVTLEVRLPNYLKADRGLAIFHAQLRWIGANPEEIPVAKSMS
jgi:hypothetical protein